MGKLLVLIIVVLAAYVVLKALAAPRRGSGDVRPGAGARGGERMVPCSRCGVNVPESEAIMSDGRYYCSDAHLRQPSQ
ncbi:MAG: PP0621 family protein [Burkholderiales bacterium]|nr:PP0621 family protein [Burkholderiales bacterium]